MERSTLSSSVITFSEREPFLRGFLCWIFDLIAQWHKWKRHIIKCRHLKYHPIYMKDQSNILEYLNKQFDSKTFSMSLASWKNVRCSLSVGTKPSQAQSRLTPGEILENKGNIDCAPTNGSRKTQTRAIFEPLLGNSIYSRAALQCLVFNSLPTILVTEGGIVVFSNQNWTPIPLPTGRLWHGLREKTIQKFKK